MIFILKFKQAICLFINRLLTLIICFLLLNSPAVRAAAHWQQDQYITDSFIDVALNREYHSKQKAHFMRWKEPLKIFIKSELGDPTLQQKLYSVQARHLQYITAHPLTFVQSESDANVIIVFSSSKNMRANIVKRAQIVDLDKILSDALCLANFQGNAKFEITRGLIFIPVDRVRQRGRLLDCVVEELTQLMGLPNDSTAVYPSIFNDRSIDSYLSGLDYLLLKIAYHPLLKPGMTEAQVRNKLPAILDQLRSLGEIENAQWRVLDNSMKKWAAQ